MAKTEREPRINTKYANHTLVIHVHSRNSRLSILMSVHQRNLRRCSFCLEWSPKTRHTVKQWDKVRNRDEVSKKKTQDWQGIQNSGRAGVGKRQECGRGGAGLSGGCIDVASLACGVGKRSGQCL